MWIMPVLLLHSFPFIRSGSIPEFLDFYVNEVIALVLALK